MNCSFAASPSRDARPRRSMALWRSSASSSPHSSAWTFMRSSRSRRISSMRSSGDMSRSRSRRSRDSCIIASRSARSIGGFFGPSLVYFLGGSISSMSRASGSPSSSSWSGSLKPSTRGGLRTRRGVEHAPGRARARARTHLGGTRPSSDASSADSRCRSSSMALLRSSVSASADAAISSSRSYFSRRASGDFLSRLDDAGFLLSRGARRFFVSAAASATTRSATTATATFAHGRMLVLGCSLFIGRA